MPKVKLKDQLRARYDKKQTMLKPDTRRGAEIRDEPIPGLDIPSTTRFMCPFCLYIDTVSKFKIRISKGYSTKRAQCPDCRTVMQMTTLTKNQTVEQYAEWVFNYALSGFWEKCPYEKFKKRMKKLGFTRRFWKKYHELKGEEPEWKTEQRYEQYLRDMGYDT